MKRFNELNIPKTVLTHFTGDKIKADRIINKEITVKAFKIEDSKLKPGEKCLHMQLAIGDTDYVFFTGSKTLMERIQKVSPSDFPFMVTIIKDDQRLDFS